MAELRSKFDTLRWRDNRLEMIDQRSLPAKISYLPFDSAVAVADGIRSMVVRGAPAIGCAAAYGIALDALRLQHQTPAEFSRGLGSVFHQVTQGVLHPVGIERDLLAHGQRRSLMIDAKGE